jgi:hypothetical protein
MSISDLIHKIKSKTGIDKVTFVYLCIIVGVAVGSFGLGRLSLDNNTNESDNIIIEEEENSLVNQNENNGVVSTTQPIQSGEKKYVASKNGKMYYSIGCSGAKRIKPENEVWFSTTEDAEKSGYALSSTCK